MPLIRPVRVSITRWSRMAARKRASVGTHRRSAIRPLRRAPPGAFVRGLCRRPRLVEIAPISNRAASTGLKLPSKRSHAGRWVVAKVASVATAHQQRRGAKRLLGRRWPACGTPAMLAVARLKPPRTATSNGEAGWSRPTRVRACTLIASSSDNSSWFTGASDSVSVSSTKLGVAHGKRAMTNNTEECNKTRAKNAMCGKARFA